MKYKIRILICLVLCMSSCTQEDAIRKEIITSCYENNYKTNKYISDKIYNDEVLSILRFIFFDRYFNELCEFDNIMNNSKLLKSSLEQTKDSIKIIESIDNFYKFICDSIHEKYHLPNDLILNIENMLFNYDIDSSEFGFLDFKTRISAIEKDLMIFTISNLAHWEFFPDEPIIIPKSTVVNSGGDYMADISLGFYLYTLPEVYLNEIRYIPTIDKKDKRIKIKVMDRPDSLGLNTMEGYFYIFKDGKKVKHPFSTTYMVTE